MSTEPIEATATMPRSENEETVRVADMQLSLLANAWYSTSELAGRLRVDTSTLRRWRTARPPQGPPFVSVSDRVVMYSALDVEEWLRSRRTVPHREA
ncbi:helix-turn-helix transcriptional regulator [Streptomyces sp. NPDC057539]|uniref:helix-turn-helix transcriptional regulator n=1 Tax=Streptomyces sp. NPDC057539 TaxID=3346159 RepID=UPI0036D10495